MKPWLHIMKPFQISTRCNCPILIILKKHSNSKTKCFKHFFFRSISPPKSLWCFKIIVLVFQDQLSFCYKRFCCKKQHTYGRDFYNFPRVHEGDALFSKSEQLRLVMSMSLDFSCVFKSFLFDCLVEIVFDVELKDVEHNMRCEHIYKTNKYCIIITYDKCISTFDCIN